MNLSTEDVALDAARRRFEEIVRSGAMRVCERPVYYAADREDRVAEGVAHCWAWYRHQSLLGNSPDVALVVHVARLRTTDRTRRFVSGDGTRWGEDVYVQQERGVELRRLDGVHDHDDGDDEERHEDLSLGLARLGVSNLEANLASSIDLRDWLDSLPSSDEEMIEMRGAGHELHEIAKATGRSVPTICRRIRDLGVELAERAGVPVPHGRRRGRAGGISEVHADAGGAA
ncbi:MAG: hypothetical protein HY907_06060 [Deltaproteobacteria bacterium]|nr:hypothetical protein [Deltaproteobacteria bacterium]